MVISKTN